jgi:ribosomal protein S18 acetylase RimI-like enzyme
VDLDELILHRLSLGARVGPRRELKPLEGEARDDVPQRLVIRHAEGFTAYFNESVSEEIRGAILGLAPSVVFEAPDTVARILGEEGPEKTRFREWYRFQDEAEIPESSEVQREGSHFIVSVDGAPASWAWTVRAHRRAELASAETVPRHRRRGMARATLGAWARAVKEAGKVGFFEHRPENEAAKNLAASLRARPFASVAEFRP